MAHRHKPYASRLSHTADWLTIPVTRRRPLSNGSSGKRPTHLTAVHRERWCHRGRNRIV